MPTVPTYDLPTVGVDTGSPGTFATTSPVQPMPDVVGKDLERLGAATVQAGATVKKVADQIRYDIADADVKALDNRMSEEQRKLIHDPKDGYLAKPGKAAIDARESVIKELEKQQQSIVDELQNEGKSLELAMFKHQCDLEAQRGQQKLAEIGAQREAAMDVGVMDAFNNAITQQAEMVKAAGGWVASLSASVRPVVTYWVLFVWSFIHVWFAWNAWLAGAPAVEVFKTMMTPDFSALLSGTINYWFLDRTLKQRGI